MHKSDPAKILLFFLEIKTKNWLIDQLPEYSRNATAICRFSFSLFVDTFNPASDGLSVDFVIKTTKYVIQNVCWEKEKKIVESQPSSATSGTGAPFSLFTGMKNTFLLFSEYVGGFGGWNKKVEIAAPIFCWKKQDFVFMRIGFFLHCWELTWNYLIILFRETKKARFRYLSLTLKRQKKINYVLFSLIFLIFFRCHLFPNWMCRRRHDMPMRDTWDNTRGNSKRLEGMKKMINSNILFALKQF